MMKRGRNMRQSFSRSSKKEEQQVVPEIYQNIGGSEATKGFLGINNFDAKVEEDDYICKLEDHFLGNNCNEHDFFGLEFLSSSWETEVKVPKKSTDESFNNIGGVIYDNNNNNNNNNISNANYNGGGDVKKEDFIGSSYGFWDENVMEETKASLNLNLNYEEVLEAWSNRGSLWAHHHHCHHHNHHCHHHNHYMGEVPNLEDERTRRKTSVLRYKEKRHNRLFSKKIRYEVRKLNADKRPRLKGRFVKRGSDNKSNTLQEA